MCPVRVTSVACDVSNPGQSPLLGYYASRVNNIRVIVSRDVFATTRRGDQMTEQRNAINRHRMSPDDAIARERPLSFRLSAQRSNKAHSMIASSSPKALPTITPCVSIRAKNASGMSPRFGLRQRQQLEVVEQK